MEIKHLGHSCFKLKGKSVSVVIDPFDSQMVGLTMPSVSADIVLSTHDHKDHNAVDKVSGTAARPQPFVINAPGEYEVSGVSVFGIATFHDKKSGEERGKNTIYSIHIEDLVVAHLGDLGHELSQKQTEALNSVDVLLVPVGGKYTIGPEEAAKVIDQIDPSMVIPMHYKVKGVAQALQDLATVEDFLKEVEAENARRESRLLLTKMTLPEDREVVVLTS